MALGRVVSMTVGVKLPFDISGEGEGQVTPCEPAPHQEGEARAAAAPQEKNPDMDNMGQDEAGNNQLDEYNTGAAKKRARTRATGEPHRRQEAEEQRTMTRLAKSSREEPCEPPHGTRRD